MPNNTSTEEFLPLKDAILTLNPAEVLGLMTLNKVYCKALKESHGYWQKQALRYPRRSKGIEYARLTSGFDLFRKVHDETYNSVRGLQDENIKKVLSAIYLRDFKNKLLLTIRFDHLELFDPRKRGRNLGYKARLLDAICKSQHQPLMDAIFNRCVEPNREHLQAPTYYTYAALLNQISTIRAGVADICKFVKLRKPEDLRGLQYSVTTPSHAAAYAGHADVVVALLDAGFYAGEECGIDCRMIAIAAMTGNAPLTKMLLDCDEDSYLTDGGTQGKKTTAIMYAAKYGHRDIFEVLLKQEIEYLDEVLDRDPDEIYKKMADLYSFMRFLVAIYQS